MALSKKQKEDLLKFSMIVAGGIIAYKIFSKDVKPVKAVKETVIDVPAKVVKEITKETKKQYFKLKNAIGV